MIFTYWHVFISLIILIIVGFLEIVMVENMEYKEYNKKPLFDHLHKIMPEISADIPTQIAIMLMIYTVVRFYNKPEILTFYFFSTTVMLIGRLSTFSITQTPPVTVVGDMNRHTRCKRTMFQKLGFKFDLSETCMDNMFSAHTANSIIPMMMVLLYSNYKYEKIAISIIALVNAFFVIISRLHYSADVIVSVFLSITVPLALKYTFIDKIIKNKKVLKL
jgi:hypothetical protein